MVIGGAFKIMPQSPKTTGFMQATPTVKSENDAKQCLSANSTAKNINNNNNTIFNFPIVQPSQSPLNAASSKANDAGNQNGSMYNSSSSLSTPTTLTTSSSSSSRLSHHEGKNMDVNDINVNVNVVASSNHAKLSTSCCPSFSMSSSSSSTFDPSYTTNNINTSSVVTNNFNKIALNTHSSTSNNNNTNNNISVISVCDGNIVDNGIIIAETHDDDTGYYDAIKLEENDGGAPPTAIIYETIVIENPTSFNATTTMGTTGHQHQPQEIILTKNILNNNNSKFITNKNHASGGGIIVLTGSLNDLLLSQNGNAGHLLTSSSTNFNGDGTNTNVKCLNDVVKNQIQSIVLNLNSQSSASATTGTSGQVSIGVNQLLAINTNQQVKHLKNIRVVVICYNYN